MTSFEVRQSFLDFFREKRHSIVQSSSLLPDSPNLLFTNAGMNQFVPIFLGQRHPDVSRWANTIPGLDTRAADTQKCIRAGGKHNDLEDVGLDTYHHTLFEMLGNWSFGDYFKKEAIEWAWELVVERWKFPANRLYATVYSPGEGDPADFDHEAHGVWKELFATAGLDPAVHVVRGGKKDNFWMMGDTGPCGPCSELHVDLTPAGDTQGTLVNRDDPSCIEIWNLVFIQFNANPDGTFSPLPAKHVDTGMGFERVTSILQGTKNFTDFANAKISNYETDIFRPIFDEIEKLSAKRYTSTLPAKGSAGDTEEERIDVAFRVIADHIRTLGFAIADGIQPGNTDRHYVLRRILRRAVRYGRTLGLHEPFFYKLVDVLDRTMGDVFPEIRAKQEHVKEVIQREEEAFNRTLDRGITLFESEANRLGSARGSRAVSGGSPETHRAPPEQPIYSKRNLPHFERPWAKYMITCTTQDRLTLPPHARDIVLDCVRYWAGRRYELFAACVMPDHLHMLIEPSVKGSDAEGKPQFFSLAEILHTVKSFTAHEINKTERHTGAVWQKESFDRMIRSESDLQEKFDYILRNPWDAEVVCPGEDYLWIWYPGVAEEAGIRRAAESGTRAACAPQISGEFAFRLYDEQGFPLDLTELMARERGLTVDVEGFEKLMEEQRRKARAAQKKEVIAISEDNLQVEPTKFLGYDFSETEAVVETVVPGRNPEELNIVLDRTTCYAEMGGQVGDHGLLHVPGPDTTEVGRLKVTGTQKKGDVFVHRAALLNGRAPETGEAIRVVIDVPRREAIQRHHTVTHLLHWALHEVVSRDAAQKGSSVGPDKLTFDFNSAPLTPQQVMDVERLVNERIVENASVSWTELPYTEVRDRPDVMQFFGDKYGDRVRVVQIGGSPGALDGYSMELCGGTHTHATGELGLFKIVSEGAIAAGVRRIEAVSGLVAFQHVNSRLGEQSGRLEELEAKLIEANKTLEKERSAGLQRQADELAAKLIDEARGEPPRILKNLGEASGDLLQKVGDALKQRQFPGVSVLAGTADGKVNLAVGVASPLTKQFDAGKIMQSIAPVVGGKGGGRPDSARGAGKDPSRIEEALSAADALLG